MTAPAEPRIVVEVGGLAVAENGPLVVLVDRGIGPLSTLAFVTGVLALVFGGFGLITLTLAISGSGVQPWWLGATSLSMGVVFACAAVLAVGRIRAARTRSLGGYRPVAVFDRARRVLVDADGSVLAPLDRVRIA